MDSEQGVDSSAASQRQAREGAGAGVTRAARRVRVLVVEDEFLVSMCLEAQVKAAGCEVVATAHEAGTGVELARSLRPDVVLMDIGLPDADGAEATRQIMAEAPTCVILVTAYDGQRVEEGLKAGARLALTKPIREEQLARAIREALAGRQE